MQARLMELNGCVSHDIYEIIGRPDKSGRISLQAVEGGAQHLVNRKRILPCEASPGASVPSHDNGRYQVVCPACAMIAIITPLTLAANCQEHGEFAIDWTGVPTMDAKVEPDVGGTTETEFSLDAVKQRGELWTKRGNLKFDHVQFAARAHVLMIEVDSVARKLCFNTYNGQLGKKTKGLDLDGFVAVGGEKRIGYVIKDGIEAERKRLIAKGYEQDS